MKKLIAFFLVIMLAFGSLTGAGMAEDKQPDRTIQAGGEADCILPGDRPYLIRLEGAEGETRIEVQSAFALRMNLTDETSGQTQEVSGKGNGGTLTAAVNGQAGKTWLIAVAAADGQRSGPFHIRIVKAEKPAAAPEKEEKATALDTPVITKITQTDASVKITWKAVDGAKKYRIYARKGESGSWELIGTKNGRKNTSFTHSAAVTRSTSGTEITYRVRAFGSGSKKSKYAAETIVRLASPGTLTLSKHSTAEDRIIATWQKVKGAKKYYVYYRTAGDAKYKVKKISGSKTKAVIPATGTQENDVYVVAVNGESKSKRTEVKHITPYWYRVLLVGEYDYPGADGYPGKDDLPGSRYDASGLNILFSKQTDRVTTLTNVSANTILNYIEYVFDGCSPNTVCVFMYSGHGDISYGYTSGALACTDRYEWSSIHPATLKEYMDLYGSDHNVILLGSCGSGGFIDPNGKNAFDPAAFNRAFISAFKKPSAKAGEFRDPRYTVIACAAAHQEGWCYWWTNQYGQLTNGCTEIMGALGRCGGYDYCNILTGNNNGTIPKQGDLNGDGKISVREAYLYAKGQVRDSDVQFWSEESGLILFP